MFLTALAKEGFLKDFWQWASDNIMPSHIHPLPELRAVHAQSCSHANIINSPHNMMCLDDSLAQYQPQNAQKHGQSPALTED